MTRMDSRITLPAVVQEPAPQSDELYGPYLHAPVWPWLTAGWMLSALYVALLGLAWWAS